MNDPFSFDDSFNKDNVRLEFLREKMKEPNRGEAAVMKLYREVNGFDETHKPDDTIKSMRRAIPILRGLSDGHSSTEMPLRDTIIASFLLLFFMPLYFIWQSFFEED